MLTAAESPQYRDVADAVHCDYFVADQCRSCALIQTPHAQQLRDKQLRCAHLLAERVPAAAWLPIVDGGERDFRNKAKLVVGGSAGAVTLGILGPDGAGVDLRDCLIQSEAIRAAIPRIAEVLNQMGIEPYRVRARRGEAKFVHLTSAPDGSLMLRCVVRTEHGAGQIRRGLAALRAAVPEATVVSLNQLPEHKAVLEGPHEELLFGSSLEMRLHAGASAGAGARAGAGAVSDHARPVALHLLPQSFFQTNTAVAEQLYAQAAEWVAAEDPDSLWDLYCGVGGFALHATREAGREPRRVLGVEISESAVASAQRSAEDAGIPAEFLAADASAFALGTAAEELPDAVIVNPPRRGIGADLAAWLEKSPIDLVIYSSCNPESLARDLAAMPTLEVVQARVFDMFPHTSHVEVMVLLRRLGSGPPRS